MVETSSQQLHLLEALFDRMPMGLAVLDRDLVLRRCNPTWAAMIALCSGVAVEQVVPGARFTDLVPGAEATSLARYHRALAGETVREEGVRVESCGRVTYWDLALVPLLEDGQIVGVVDVTVDANDRREAEEALREHHTNLEEVVGARTAQLVTLNRQLEEALAERQRATAALRASEEKYRELVENANSIILRMDRHGNVTFFNEFAQRFFGFAAEEILGRHVVGTIVPERDAEGTDMATFVADVTARPDSFASSENENVRASGERVWIAWTNRSIRDAEGRLLEVLCVGNDVTARKQAEEALARVNDALEQRVAERTAELSHANEVLQQQIAERRRAEEELERRSAFEKLISGISTNFINLAPGDVDAGINQALRAIGEFAGVDRSYVFLYSDDGNTISNTHEWCAAGVEPQKPHNQNIARNRDAWWTERLQRREVINLPSLDALPPQAWAERVLLAAQGIVSLVAVPLVYRNATVGFLGLDAVRAATQFPEAAVDQLRLTGEIIVNALQRKRGEEALLLANQTLEQRVEDRTSELSTLLAVQQAISSHLDPQEMLTMIADEVRRLTGASKAVVYLLEGEQLRISVLSGDLDPSMLGMTIPLQGSVVGLSVLTGQPQITETAGSDPRSHLETVRRSGSRHVLAVPLVYGDRPIGAIALANKSDGPFDPEDVRKLTTLAAGAAIDLENARLFQEEQERRQEAEQRRQVAEGLREVVTILNSNRPLQEILEHIVRQACRLMGTDTAALMRLDEGGGTLSIQAAHGLPMDELSRLKGDIGRGTVGRTVVTRQPVIINDRAQLAADDPTGFLPPQPAAARLVRSFPAALAVPLLVKEEVYGGIVLYYKQPHEFSEEEVALAVAFADQAALAIENARLRERAEQLAVAAERSRLARDLHDAVTQTLFSASLIAEVLPRLWERNPDEGRRRLEELRQLTRGALAEMRTLLLELRPTALTEAALGDLLKQLAEAINGRARLPVSLTIEGQRPLPAEVQVALYRIAQEALNNVAKHSGASSVAVVLRCLGDRVELSVSDDGRGFDRGVVPPNHLGLGIMSERAEAIGALLALESKPGQGTNVSVVWIENAGRKSS
ncbi:MAG: GAF domain-containing protein [Chloroflexota bacterium]